MQEKRGILIGEVPEREQKMAGGALPASKNMVGWRQKEWSQKIQPEGSQPSDIAETGKFREREREELYGDFRTCGSSVWA